MNRTGLPSVGLGVSPAGITSRRGFCGPQPGPKFCRAYTSSWVLCDIALTCSVRAPHERGSSVASVWAYDFRQGVRVGVGLADAPPGRGSCVASACWASVRPMSPPPGRGSFGVSTSWAWVPQGCSLDVDAAALQLARRESCHAWVLSQPGRRFCGFSTNWAWVLRSSA